MLFNQHNHKTDSLTGLASLRVALWRGWGALRGGGRGVFGLDIGSFAIRLVGLRWHGAEVQVEHLAALPLPIGGDGDEDDGAAFDPVARDCHRACSLAGVRQRSRVAAAIPYGRAIVLDTTAPARLRGAALERELMAQLARQLSELPRTLHFDYERAPPLPDNPGQARINLTLCRGEAIDDLRAVLDGCGLQLAVVEPDLFALERSLLRRVPGGGGGGGGGAGGDGAVLLFDLGHGALRLALALIERGRAQVVRRYQHAFGGEQLLLALRRLYGWSEAEARRRLWQGDAAINSEDGAAVIGDFADRLASEVAEVVALHEDVIKDRTAASIVAAGGCALLPGVVAAIALRTGLVVRVAQPLVGMAPGAAADLDTLSRHGAALAVATGLALRGDGDAED